jgi:endoglucanase
VSIGQDVKRFLFLPNTQSFLTCLVHPSPNTPSERTIIPLGQKKTGINVVAIIYTSHQQKSVPMQITSSFPKLAFVFALALGAGSGCKDTTESTEPLESISTTLESNAVGAAGISGANWADARDNFVTGWVIPSGLTASDSYATVQSKADKVLTGFQNGGINTVRLPINPPSVLESWWNAYNGAIDKALSRNMKVILAVWEEGYSKDGRVDDLPKFWSMWQTVINKYGGNSQVYFEVFNEPHGYNLSDLTSLYAEFLSRYPSVPKGRILLGGTGYSENVTGVGADSRFNGCLLAIHDYSFFVNNSITTATQWENRFQSNVGAYASRTVLTEFGAPMTTGKNYTGAIGGDGEKAYIQGMTNKSRLSGIASVYWPGLRDNDSYSLYTFNGTTMTLTNASGLSRLQYGWGVGNGGTNVFYSTAYYRLINRNSNLLVDVNNASSADGATILQWPSNGGNNQQWQVLDNNGGYFRIINRNSGKALDVNGGSLANGASIIQWAFNGGNNQQWQILDNGGGYFRILNRNSGQALDVNGSSTANGASIIQWPFNGGNNQQWLILQQ